MLKKNLFHKKLSKIVLSITKRIESFFNLFKGLHSVKKIYLNSKKAILDKKIFFVLGTALILVIVYFLLPSFYDADKVKAQVENQILQEYNLKVKLNKKLQYGLFPKPHFLSVDAIIEHDSRIISSVIPHIPVLKENECNEDLGFNIKHGDLIGKFNFINIPLNYTNLQSRPEIKKHEAHIPIN